jgi:hypothetical protein
MNRPLVAPGPARRLVQRASGARGGVDGAELGGVVGQLRPAAPARDPGEQPARAMSDLGRPRTRVSRSTYSRSTHPASGGRVPFPAFPQRGLGVLRLGQRLFQVRTLARGAQPLFQRGHLRRRPL